MHSILALACVAQLASAQAVTTQPVLGVVTTRSGAAMPDALVEVWSASQRVGRVRTDAGGRFRVLVDVSPTEPGPLLLIVRRIGFEEHRVDARHALASGDSIRVILIELPVALPTVVVKTSDACPHADDARARQLWLAARKHYSTATDTLTTSAYMASGAGVVAEGLIGEPPLTGSLGSGSIGATGYARASARAEIVRAGYAVRRTSSFQDADFGVWIYAPLDTYFADHFIDETFGASHSFSNVRVDDDGLAISFCPMQQGRPDISGTLRFAADTTLASAIWAFHTPEPRERAGGLVAFVPAEAPGPSLLLPTRGYFWRQAPTLRQQSTPMFVQRWREYERWIIAPAGRNPGLPVRDSSKVAGEVSPRVRQ